MAKGRHFFTRELFEEAILGPVIIGLSIFGLGVVLCGILNAFGVYDEPNVRAMAESSPYVVTFYPDDGSGAVEWDNVGEIEVGVSSVTFKDDDRTVRIVNGTVKIEQM